MSFTSKGTAEIIAAGLQDSMFVIDLIKGEVVKQVRNNYSYCSPVPLIMPVSDQQAGSDGAPVLDYETRALYMRSDKERIGTPFRSHHFRHCQDLECPFSLNQ
jgi:hypothetical protein